MNSGYAKREKREIIKLVIISILVVLLYLAVSFKEVYGYPVSEFYNSAYDHNQAIHWNSDRWMNPPSSEDYFTFDYQERFTGLPSGSQNHHNQNHAFDSNTPSSDYTPTIPEPGVILLVGLGLTGIQIARKLFQ